MARTHSKWLLRLTATPIIILLAASNWYVHQPASAQQSYTRSLPASLEPWIERLGNATADTTDSLGLTGRDATVPLTSPLATNSLVFAGIPRRLPKGPAPDDIVILRRTGFVIGYSPSLRHPAWVAYKTYPIADRPFPPRPSGFKPDPSAQRSPSHKDYTKSGYDRGHMAPNLAIAKRYGKTAQAQTFLTSNICPQRPALNQGPWRDLEFRISELWPSRYDTVWVIVGAVEPEKSRRLASGIDIPSGFYQIVVTQQSNRIRAFAVYMPQSVRRYTVPRTTLVSIDRLEALTGLDFLSELPDDIECELESATPTRLWPTGLLGACRLLYERFRTYD